jgi:leucyl aminopeptidase
MKIKVETTDIVTIDTPALVVNLFKGVTKPGGATGAVDQALDGAISGLIDDGEITGKLGELTLLHTMGRIGPARVVVAGLGRQEDFGTDIARQVSSEALRYLRRRGVCEAATIAHGAGIGGLSPEEAGQAIAEGALLGLYRFDRYHTNGDDADGEFAELTIVERDTDRADAIRSGAARGGAMAGATLIARDMVNEPANAMTPTAMAETALQVAKENGLGFEVLDNADMKRRGMGAFMGVAQGSDEPAKLIILTYDGDQENPGNNLGLIGKGITFDTGGISIKPAAGMEYMKGDMAGGASVIGAMKAIGRLKPRINVVGMVAATENMPGGSAQRPGDVVKSMSGKTIEVINTDAEGRLVLADALFYARQMGVSRLVDIATLTGAMVVALGNACSGVMGNDQDLVDRVIESGASSGERIWQLPLYDDYREQIRSNVADIKNTGGRAAGSLTAGQFLAEFVEETSWAHLDIAGTYFSSKEKGYLVKGGTGVPTRTLVNLAMDLGRQE